MRQVVIDLLDNLNKSNVVKPLIKDETFIIKITCDTEEYYIELKDIQFFLLTKDPPKSDIVLEGSENCLRSILLGKTLLRNVISEKKIIVHSTLRKLLKLESLLYLVNI
ncbi:hypothetical protein [Niallia sp. 03133]|uniref:hypothetical protein n=1 Tax=Niallia sp. 03133 TaxID=3458060 RepID=UPI0040446509